MSNTKPAIPSTSLTQPVFSGLLAAVIGFASSVAIVLAGFTAVGASQAQAESGLFAISVVMGVLGIGFAVVTRQPVTITWSTPGVALLITSGAPAGGYPAVVGAYLVAAVLIIAAGLWRPFARAVAAIPLSLAGAMLAGVLMEICLAPMHAMAAEPLLTLPIVIAWAVALRFARPFAIPIAVAVTAIVVAVATPLPPEALAHVLARPVLVLPTFHLGTLIGIGVPLFIVTMASQNVPGLAVLSLNGYRPDVRPIFVWTGLGSIVTAFLGGHSLNLAALTAALCAGPEADPDPARRWIASAACGAGYVVLGLGAGFATAFLLASPPLLIEAVAGLALIGSLAGAFSSALAREEHRLPAAVTFLVTASGVSSFGIGAAFWGLVAGGALMALFAWRPR